MFLYNHKSAKMPHHSKIFIRAICPILDNKPISVKKKPQKPKKHGVHGKRNESVIF